MYVPTRVKVCGLTREEDVDRALEAGAAFCGFIVWPKSARGLDWERACELAARVPAGKRVLVDVETATDVLAERVDGPFDFFQIHCNPDVSWGTLAGWSGLAGRERLWLAPRIPPGQAFPADVLEFTDTVLLDAYSPVAHGGTGLTGDWEGFATLKNTYIHKQWVLAGGLNPDNIAEACRVSGAEVIDVNSGIESAPRIKDAAKMAAFFAAVPG